MLASVILGLTAALCAQAVCPAEFPPEICVEGQWPNSDKNINGDWWPSRSTHYGGTSGGACGMGDLPNCVPGSCAGVPADLTNNPHAGMYAAPQGNYYAQKVGYLSCGECFEIRCVDSQCTNTQPITIQIADACPCFCNTKWCCGNYSYCSELGPDTSGKSHCAINSNSWWEPDSLHLDLSDTAIMAVAFGNKTGPMPGVINTMARRVACKVTGNVYAMTTPSVSIMTNCYTVYPQPTRDCFYYLAFAVVNVQGSGSVTKVETRATLIQNGTLVDTWVPFPRDPTSDPARPQEQYGTFVGPLSVSLFFPLQFRITNRYGQVITSREFKAAADWPTGQYIDLGVQFPALS